MLKTEGEHKIQKERQQSRGNRIGGGDRWNKQPDPPIGLALGEEQPETQSDPSA